MNNVMKYLAAAMMISTGISIIACGGTTNSGNLGGDDCTFDDDCPLGTVCATDLNQCVPTCLDDTDCTEGVCRTRLNATTDEKTCQYEDPQNNTTQNNTPQNNTMSGSQCTPETQLEDCGEDGLCGDDGFCVDLSGGDTNSGLPNNNYWIMIQDVSAGDDACGGTDPGSDLLGLRLNAADGQFLAWGKAYGFNVGDGDNNKYINTTRIDGTGQDLTETDRCPDSDLRFSDIQPFSMGCGGWVLISFEQDDVPVPLEEGQQIEVLEYGPNCGGVDADRYQVYFCTDSEDADGASNASCTVALGRGDYQGHGDITISNLP